MIGNFILQKTHSGNLTGEFTNQLMNFISTESADLIEGQPKSFEGTYISTWRENNEAFLLTLTISVLPNTAESKFHLEWFTLENLLIYVGQGFISNNALIGFYENVEN